jgi:hypothetical protein
VLLTDARYCDGLGPSYLDVAITYIPMAHNFSNDGNSTWRDIGFVERLWPSDKYEKACLHANDISSESRERQYTPRKL